MISYDVTVIKSIIFNFFPFFPFMVRIRILYKFLLLIYISCKGVVNLVVVNSIIFCLKEKHDDY